MGKFIYCIGNKAKLPYTFQTTGISVYTMEELCYYLYHNIDTLEEDLSNISLISWIRTELGMTERADFLEQLIHRGSGLKDIVVSIFVSTDYYTEEEINNLIKEIDQLYDMLPVERKKRHADMLMRFHKYREAGFEYRQLMDDREFSSLATEAQGDVAHNLGVLTARNGRFQAAAKLFDSAYHKNNNKESLCQYIYCLKLDGDEEGFNREISEHAGDDELVRRIENQFYFIEDNREYNSDYLNVLKLMEIKDNDEDFWWLFDETLGRLKQSYRENQT
ncbi:MAG: hypothetical protein IKR27_09715 [Lachnospiraceae bacterium]|nr:hypothetical protein [Lachnospiraceae bacterium]MBR6275270.1 hypothetical protein [Lachnospiraceae bacterium]